MTADSVANLVHGARAIVFDAVGTLIRPRPSVGEAYAAAGRRFGLVVDEAEIAARFRRAFAAEEARDRDGTTSEARERERWEAIVATVFPTAADPAGMFTALWDHFADAAHWALDPEVAALFDRLHALGLTVAVASNFDERLPGLCRAWPALARVPVFVSSAVGYRKPDRRFFDTVRARLALPAESLVMVGDDLENDYRGATAAGWQAIHLARADRGPAAVPLSTPAPHTVARLAELG